MDEQTYTKLSASYSADNGLDRSSSIQIPACDTGKGTPISKPFTIQPTTLEHSKTDPTKRQPSTPDSTRPPLTIRSWAENLMHVEITKEGRLCSAKYDAKQGQEVLEMDLNTCQQFDSTQFNALDPFYDSQNPDLADTTELNVPFMRDRKPPITLCSTRKRVNIESPLIKSKRGHQSFGSRGSQSNKSFVEDRETPDLHVSSPTLTPQSFNASIELSFSQNTLSHSTPYSIKSRNRSRLLAPSSAPFKTLQAPKTPLSNQLASFVNDNSSLRAKHFGLSFYDSTSFSSLDDADEIDAKKKAQRRFERVLDLSDDCHDSSNADESASSSDSEPYFEEKPSIKTRTNVKNKQIRMESESEYSEASDNNDKVSTKKKYAKRQVPRKRIGRKASVDKHERIGSYSPDASDHSVETQSQPRHKILQKKARGKGSDKNDDEDGLFEPDQNSQNSDVTNADSFSRAMGQMAVRTSTATPKVGQEQSVQHEIEQASPSADKLHTMEKIETAKKPVKTLKKNRKKRSSDEAFKPDASDEYDSGEEMDVKVKPLVDALINESTHLEELKVVTKDDSNVVVEVTEHLVEEVVVMEETDTSERVREPNDLRRAVNIHLESDDSLEDRQFPFASNPGIGIMTQLMARQDRGLASTSSETYYGGASATNGSNDLMDRPRLKKSKLSQNDDTKSVSSGIRKSTANGKDLSKSRAIQNEQCVRLFDDNQTNNNLHNLQKFIKRELADLDRNTFDVDHEMVHMRRLTTAPYPNSTKTKVPIVSIHQSQQGLYRRQLINEQTFHDNVQLISSQRDYAFRCCSCQQMSMVHIEWFQDEIVWSTAICQSCHKHRCCSNCTRYEDSRESLAAPLMCESWWDFEYFLHVRKKAFEERQSKLKEQATIWRRKNQQENINPLLTGYQLPSPNTPPPLMIRQDR